MISLKSIQIRLLIFLLASPLFAQSEKDIVLNEKIFNEEDYFQAKHLLLELEEKTGYLPQETFHFLNASYKADDLLFLKTNLIKLTKEYGFDLSLLKPSTSYYTSIVSGSLSEWFKEVYPQARAKWLAENYWKIPYIKELNDLYVKDKCGKYRQFNIDELLWICKEIGGYPNAKNFALAQTDFFIVEMHLIQSPDFPLDYFKKIYPYWEKAYLEGNMDYTHFKNFDIQLFLATGKQYFGLLHPKKMPETLLEMKNMDRNDSIPVLDAENLAERRKKLGWN